MAETPDSRQLLDTLRPWLRAPRWWLGLSGGLDSCVLLHLLVEAGKGNSLPPLTAIHVDHQLSVNARSWTRHCEDLCLAGGIEFESRHVTVEAAGQGLEAAARRARYDVFEQLLGPGDLLLLAHHFDDQLETFFLRLMRGAGPRGLSGMPMSRPLGRGELCRPLLGFARSCLEDYARTEGLRWVEDESNRDLALDRNFLRHRVLPLLEERWPGYRSSIAGSMGALADAEASLASQDHATLVAARTVRFGEAALRLDVLAAHSESEIARLLRRWLETEGVEPPGRERLREFARQLRSAQPDARPVLSVAGYALRRYRDGVHLCPSRPAVRLPEPAEIAPGEVLRVPGLGRLEMRPVPEGGARLPPSGHWRLGLRQGGERCRPAGRDRSQSLKKLLQDGAVPPWLRDRLPLLYADGELAAVADLWVCSGWEAETGGGYALHWEWLDTGEPD